MDDYKVELMQEPGLNYSFEIFLDMITGEDVLSQSQM